MEIVFLGGEAPVEFFEFQEVSAKSWAAKLNALYIAIEHRFYGDSMPTPDFGTYNLKFLSSQQALADASYFIESYNSTLIKPGPWIVLGCSYSGALSAWFRSKYPHLVVGSVAPSGPVFAQTNYSGYYAHFQRVAGGSCISAVKSAVAEISTMLKTDSGRSQLSVTQIVLFFLNVNFNSNRKFLILANQLEVTHQIIIIFWKLSQKLLLQVINSTTLI